jgi:ribonuclease P protein component
VVRLDREQADRPGVAFAISRKVGGAVVRNRLRRQLRVAASAATERGILPPGWYLVMVAPGAGGSSMTTLSGHLEAAIRLLPTNTSVRD